jgi:hypothetical protein
MRSSSFGLFTMRPLGLKCPTTRGASAAGELEFDLNAAASLTLQ